LYHRNSTYSILEDGGWINKDEKFNYDSKNLLRKYTIKSQFSPVSNCFTNLSDEYRTEWRYRYNPMNEREQKRMYYAPKTDSSGMVYPWVYYLLGGKNEQYAVYHGAQLFDYEVDCMDSSSIFNLFRSVFIYPSEYNVYTGGSQIPFSYRQDSDGNWRKDFNIYDHLGNLRVVMRDTTANTPYLVRGLYDYEPFGAKISSLKNKDRLSFIGKEKDLESKLGDFGVRKYDDFSGRFVQIEPFWEKYVSWSPYVYSMNNSIILKDENGLLPGDAFNSPAQAAHDFGKNYNPFSNAINVELSTTIYKYQDQSGADAYTYAIPNGFNEIGSNATYSTINKEGYKRVAEVHTHGPYSPEKENTDGFSPKDKRNKDVNQYLITPGGFLKLFIPGTSVCGKIITKDMPQDRLYEKGNWQEVDRIKDKRPIPLLLQTEYGMNYIYKDARTEIERK
jgi:RHS repeat-associated protein